MAQMTLVGRLRASLAIAVLLGVALTAGCEDKKEPAQRVAPLPSTGLPPGFGVNPEAPAKPKPAKVLKAKKPKQKQLKKQTKPVVKPKTESGQ